MRYERVRALERWRITTLHQTRHKEFCKSSSKCYHFLKPAYTSREPSSPSCSLDASTAGHCGVKMSTTCLLSIGPNTSHTHFFRWRHHECPFHNRGRGGSVRLTHSPVLTQQDFSRARFEFMPSTSRACFFFLGSKSRCSLGKTHTSSHPHECICFVTWASLT